MRKDRLAIVYGGGNVGLMGIVADAALAAGGEVIGVIPEQLVGWEVAHRGLTRLEVVANMHERKARMFDLSDGFVALPGGFGTLDEMFEMLTWRQLGLGDKPCAFLDVDGFYAPLIAMLDRMVEERFLRAEQRRDLWHGEDIDALLDWMRRYRPAQRTSGSKERKGPCDDDSRDAFHAFRIHDDASGYRSGIEDVSLDDLAPGEIVIQAAYSSVNYKDALAGTGKGKILRRFPLVGGIDVAGHVVASSDPRFQEGDRGAGHRLRPVARRATAAIREYVRLESHWTIPLPAGLSLRESMILGTAGFTAALALYRMLDNRQTPELGPAAVTGATGGVGSLAVDIFSRAGFEVHAISGKPEHADYLRGLGAREVLGRDALATTRPMDSARFGGGLDNVGGPMLASLLAQTAPYGNVASAGLAASPALRRDGHAIHHPRRLAAGHRLGRHRARHPRSASGSTWPATGNRRTWIASARAKSTLARTARRFRRRCSPAARSDGRWSA